MEPPIPPLVFAVLLLMGMLLMLEVGRYSGVRRRPKESEGERSGLGTVEGAVFALFGLMVAFTFSGAASRFNEKRMLNAEEANCIETAYLRLHLLSHPVQPALRELFRRYVDSRIETYRILPNMVAAEVEMAKSKKIQEEVWTQAVEATQLPDSHASAGLLLLTALNNMIDIATTRSMSLQLHPPRIIFALLFGLGLICSLLAVFSDVEWPTPELASHSRLHSPHRYHRLRHARRRVPPRGVDPPGIRRPGAGQSPRAYEVTVSDEGSFR